MVRRAQPCSPPVAARCQAGLGSVRHTSLLARSRWASAAASPYSTMGSVCSSWSTQTSSLYALISVMRCVQQVEASAGPAAHGRGARVCLPRPAHARQMQLQINALDAYKCTSSVMHKNASFQLRQNATKCSNTSDSLCQRRRPGAEYADSFYGSDCADCGPRFPPPPLICAETCNSGFRRRLRRRRPRLGEPPLTGHSSSHCP